MYVACYNSSYVAVEILKYAAATTPASNMSKNWITDYNIPVSGKSTVQDAMNGAGGTNKFQIDPICHFWNLYLGSEWC